MSELRVLVVDDEPAIRRFLQVNLAQRGYQVTVAPEGFTAIQYMEQELPDLVVLDLAMPGMNGVEICNWIRERSDVPVIVMSAHHEEELKVKALDSGADDYITKPFGQEEFMARIRALMRRATTSSTVQTQQFVNATPTVPDEQRVQLGGLSIHLKARRAFVDQQDIHLTRTEFSLLAELAKNMDAILTHDELLARVWGEEYRGSSHYLHVYFGRIRKKMGDIHATLLESVPGVGYILHSTMPL